jgi:hypothetical protein
LLALMLRAISAIEKSAGAARAGRAKFALFHFPQSLPIPQFLSIGSNAVRKSGLVANGRIISHL